MATSDSIVFHQGDLLPSYVSIFREMRRTGELCDVVIKTGDKFFPVHRVVLAAGIPYFRAMFNSDMLEGTAKEITVKEMDPHALESLINFAYSGKVRISKENVETLTVASSFLQLEKVRDTCCGFMADRIDPKNVLNVRHLADSLGCASLVDISDRYITEHFEEVSVSEEFLRLPFGFLRDLIQRDDLAVTQEENVYEAVIRWVKSSNAERQDFLPELLKAVRMLFLTPDFLINRVNSEDLMRSSPTCRDLLDEVKNYHLLPENRSPAGSLAVQPRSKTRLKYVALANSGSQGLYALCYSKLSGRYVKYFDSESGRWYTISTDTRSRSFCCVLAEKSRIYAIGEKKKIETFKLITQEWTGLGPISSSFCRTAVAIHDNKIYCFGGSFVSSDKVRCFDPETKSWLREGRTKIRRTSPGVVALGESIYVLGDYSNNGAPFSVEKYNPQTGRSRELPPMLSNRYGHGAAALNGKIFVCGGYHGQTLDTAEVYDPAANQWSAILPMGVPRYHFSLVSCNGKLYAVGGLTLKGNTPTVEAYDPETNEWSFCASVCSISEYPTSIKAFALSSTCD